VKFKLTPYKIAAIAVGIRAVTFSIMSEKIAKNIRKDFYESTINKDVAFYDERRTGDLSKFFKMLTI
jgi:ABC-type bacteriocin/lantibiotic exporter with double-glycine peptidase domain